MAAQIEQAASWWAENRSIAPRAIEEELQRAFALLAAQPALGARTRTEPLVGLRRIRIRRIHYYPYYRVSAEAVDVLAFWHTSRGGEPPLQT